jgi:hypothetical protein
MIEESSYHSLDKEIAILRTKLEASEKALSLALETVKSATNNSYSLFSLIASIAAILVSCYAIYHKP